MTITERTLKKWRSEALYDKSCIRNMAIDEGIIRRKLEIQERILRMTQELLDQHLVRRMKK